MGLLNRNNYTLVLSRKNTYVFLVLLLVSVLSSIIIAFQTISGSSGYELSFILPIFFIVLISLTRNAWDEMPANIGLSVLVFIEFVRMVISPLLVCSFGCQNIIEYNAYDNNLYGTILLAYECLAITIVLLISKKSNNLNASALYSLNYQRMAVLILAVLIVTIISNIVAPEILLNYRFIGGLIFDPEFTNLEQSQIVNAYSSSIIKKFFLVTNNYLLKVVRLFIPACILVCICNSSIHIIYKKICAFIVILSPFLFVDGAIARSLIYSVLLWMLYRYSMEIDRYNYYLVFAVFIAIIAFFYVRYYVSNQYYGFGSYIARKSIDYFSGINIVGGSNNLPKQIGIRFHYFCGDILRSVPYANTIFGLKSNDTVQIFFNHFNYLAGGQIPTTIGMGAYYFTPLFSPLYSCCFAFGCKRMGELAIKTEPSLLRMVYLYMSILFALGIGMYNIEITLGTLVQVVLPLYVLVKIIYTRKAVINDI